MSSFAAEKLKNVCLFDFSKCLYWWVSGWVSRWFSSKNDHGIVLLFESLESSLLLYWGASNSSSESKTYKEHLLKQTKLTRSTSESSLLLTVIGKRNRRKSFVCTEIEYIFLKIYKPSTIFLFFFPFKIILTFRYSPWACSLCRACDARTDSSLSWGIQIRWTPILGVV